MTTQDAGRPPREGSSAPAAASGEGQSTVDFDEAERIASMIRPAWELGLSAADLEPHPEPAAAAPEPSADASKPPRPAASKPAGPSVVVDKQAEPSRPSLTSSEAKLAEGGVDPAITAGASISLLPRDTVIDGVPTVGVGERASGQPAAAADAAPADSSPSKGAFAAAIAEGIAIVDRGAPAADASKDAARRAGATKLGLGESAADAVRAATAEREQETTTAMPVSASLREAGAADAPPSGGEVAAAEKSGVPKSKGVKGGGTIRMDASQVAAATRSTPPPEPRAAERRSSAPVEPQGASPSRVDDPIELPVQKSGGVLAMVIGGVAVVGAIVAGVMIFGGSSDQDGDAKTKDTKTSQATGATTTTATATAAATATAKQTATATAAVTASATATETASAAPTETASAAASSAPTVSASVAAPPPKTSEPAKPPTTSTASKPPPPPKSTGTAKPPPPPGGIIRDTPF